MPDKVALLFAHASNAIGEVVVDAIVEEVHSIETRVTEHPVESGPVVVDHVQQMPESLRLEGIISNTPVAFFGSAILSSGDRVDTAFKQLEEIVRTGTLIDIITTLKTYKSMAIENFAATRNASNAEALCFSCSAKHVRIVAGRTIEIKLPKVARVQKKKSFGKQPTVKPSEAVEKKARSLLSTLWDGL